MANPVLNRKYVGKFAVSSPYGIPQWLDAMYTAGMSALYYGGAARTPGSGSAHTVYRHQNAGTTEAVYGTPPTDPGLTPKWICAGAAGAKTPTMRSPHTWTTNVILASVNKNSGAFNAWDNASPFTSGQFFGYLRGFAVPSTAGFVHMMEDEECVYWGFEISSTSALTWVFQGPWVDPGVYGGLNSESDNRRYCIAVQGTAVAFSTGFNTVNPTFLSLTATANGVYAASFDPGAGTSCSLSKVPYVTTAMFTANDATTRLLQPYVFYGGTSSYGQGVTRKIYPYHNVIGAAVVTDISLNILGLSVGANAAAVNDALLLAV